MSAAGPRRAPEGARTSAPAERSPEAHLLHALNQPLTGLQCSLELAIAGPRTLEQHQRVLREGLELTARMRILVEALRELVDTREQEAEPPETFLLNTILSETVEDLRPVAETRKVDLRMAAEIALAVRARRGQVAAALFRSLDAPLSMTPAGGELRIAARREGNQAVLSISWSEERRQQHSPFSRPELALLIARVGWERAGADYVRAQAGENATATIRLPLASPESGSPDWES
ncbi:MAG TPA: hypothetical protein VLY22_00055 [Candidatus Nitrosotalea sp.]|nr:hypothetical protein [Candidatus Nitrosotalea sp.]